MLCVFILYFVWNFYVHHFHTPVYAHCIIQFLTCTQISPDNVTNKVHRLFVYFIYIVTVCAHV